MPGNLTLAIGRWFMNETEQKLSSIEEKKEKIRQRYKGIDVDQLSIIPPKPKLDIFDRERVLRVAVYARVSTDDPNQTSSYELQKNHYTDIVNRNPNWVLVDIYADEGISGTSLQHRDNFIRMINDCSNGLIDLIVTKSVSRFARNLLDSVGYVRKLGALNPPVGVFFETENINTLNKDSEMALAFIATMAQEESHNKSEIMNASIEMRFNRGIFLTPPLLGYDQDEDGNLVINEEEAKTVRLIFFMYIYGYSCQQIADTLTKLGRKTKKGNTVWYGSTVLAQLTNERHCGSILARKTYTPNYLDHKSKKNRNERTQVFLEEHHEPIISRKDFIYVQHLIANTKNGNNNILPELHVIPSGVLAGYVSINPRWTGFKPIDYISASESVGTPENNLEESEKLVTVRQGEFDLRGYEIVRSQFFDVGNRLAMTFSSSKLKFSVACLHKLESEYIEILIHPIKKIIAIRSSTPENRLNFKWMRKKDGICVPRDISLSHISPCIYGLLGWNEANRYRMYGTYHQTSTGILLLFNVADSEIFIPKNTDNNESDISEVFDFPDNVDTLGTKNSTLAFPASWADGFGMDYYSHANQYESTVKQNKDPIVISMESVAYNPTPEIEVPDPEIIASQLQDAINDITAEEKKNE